MCRVAQLCGERSASTRRAPRDPDGARQGAGDSPHNGHVNVENTQVYLTVEQVLLREGERRFQAGFEGLAEKALNRARRKRA